MYTRIVLSDVLETTLSVMYSANVSLAFFELLWVRWTFFIGRLPKIPGTLAALVVGGIIHTIQLVVSGQPMAPLESFAPGLPPTEWMSALGFDWRNQMGTAVNYLPVALPFALCTVVGGIDRTESAFSNKVSS